MLGKIKRIRADLSENRLNSGNFFTILHTNSGKLSTAPLESISPVRLCLFRLSIACSLAVSHSVSSALRLVYTIKVSVITVDLHTGKLAKF
jgi:hypothetical protein